jgi:hypothetical protein
MPNQLKIKALKIIVIATIFLTAQQILTKNAIVPCEWDGRLGDQIMLYMATKYVAMTYDMNFFYREFKNSDKFMLSRYDKKFDSSIRKNYKHIISIKNFQDLESIKNNSNALFVLQWGLVSGDTRTSIFEKKYFNAQFLAHMQQMLTLINPLNQPILEIPAGHISIAVHVRKGEGFDIPLQSIQIYKNNGDDHEQLQSILQKTPHVQNKLDNRQKSSDQIWPSKFPPEQYYIDQINNLTKLLADKKIIIYIFSDSLDPASLTKRIKAHCSRKDLTFVTVTGIWQNSLFFDLYAMSECDCLICSTSMLSYAAEIIGNHAVVIRPYTHEWQGNILYIKESKINLFGNKNIKNVELIFNEQNKAYINKLLHKYF